MTPEVLTFMHGALTMGCFLVGVKFLKFWHTSKDRFFMWFVAAFWVFSIGWGIRAFSPSSADHLLYVYVPRLLAFLLIIAGIFDKNRKARS